MPRCILTAEQIASIPARMAKGEKTSAIGREFGVTYWTIRYHAQGGKTTQHVGAPWRPHTNAAYAAINKGNHAEAAYHFKQAADVLIKL